MTDPFSQDTAFPKPSRRLRLGFVGGGQGALIGVIQATGAHMSGRWDVVAGALSSHPDVALASGKDWFIDDDRAYTDYRDMAVKEAARPDGIDAVCIVTPNDRHHAMCCAFLDAGIDIICDKPLTTTLEDAIDLVRRARKADVVFGVTHAFAANAMVRQMRNMVAAGTIGRLRMVHVQYFDEFLALPGAEETKQFSWRIDPAQSGMASTVADIGTHAWHLSSFVTGLEMQRLSAQFHLCGRPKAMEDTAFMQVRFAGQCARHADGFPSGRGRTRRAQLAALWRWRPPGVASKRGRQAALHARGRGRTGADPRRGRRRLRGHPALRDAAARLQ